MNKIGPIVTEGKRERNREREERREIYHIFLVPKIPMKYVDDVSVERRVPIFASAKGCRDIEIPMFSTTKMGF